MLIIKTVITAAISIVVMFILTKIMGNKQISQLNLFDYINGITIGSIAAEAALAETATDLVLAAVAMTVYGLTGFFISIATMNSMTARKFISGEPLLLIENGRIYSENLKKARLDVNDLLIAARCDGIYSVSDVAFAVIEPNGRISFCQTESSRPVNMTDLGQTVEEKSPPVNLIIDGLIMTENAKNAGLTVKDISDEMRRQGFTKPEEIFLAVMYDNVVTFYPKNHDAKKLDYYTD